MDQNVLWDNIPEQDLFLESMADAASSVHNHFKGNIAYINMMVNMSVDCDCCAKAEDPCMKDIGILASLDPIAIDQACIDLVYNSNDKDTDIGYGYGFRLNYHQTVKPVTIGSTAYYEYVDEDGTAHYFYKDENQK